MFKILVADSLPADILNKYDRTEGVSVVNKSGISKEDLIAELADYDGLVVRSRTKVKADVLAAAKNLKVIGRAGAGVDNIDTDEATKRGIIVMNTPGGNTIAAAEHTLAMMLAGLRNIAPANASMRQKKWDRKSFIGHEIYQKTVGVVGLGKIGREVAKRLNAFGANVLGYDPILTSEHAARLGIKLVDLEELYRRSDIITLHVPKMKETLNMINKETLAQCKDGVIIVNCARGGIVHEGDLTEALDSGKVALAALDVWSNEPPEDFSLACHPKVLATPHLGASTEEAQVKVADQILAQMIEYFTKNVARNAVNFVSVDAEIQDMIAPFFELARRLGMVFNQIKNGRLREISVRYYGRTLEVPVEPITSYLLMGALKSATENPDIELVNPVNALTIARERGISIEIAKKDTPLTVHTNAIACDFITDSETVHLAGSVVGQNIYHLIEFGPFKLSAELGGQMLFIENDNVPGIIGKVGTLLGEVNINIAHLSSGRDGDPKEALNVFNVAGNLQSDLQSRLESVSGINRVLLAVVDSAR